MKIDFALAQAGAFRLFNFILIIQFLSITTIYAGDSKPETQLLAIQALPIVKNYFDSFRQTLKERDYVIDLATLALISEEHMLLMGPPGNAKSMLADEILGHLIDEQTGK